jgi:hypothetical protein
VHKRGVGSAYVASTAAPFVGADVSFSSVPGTGVAVKAKKQNKRRSARDPAVPRKRTTCEAVVALSLLRTLERTKTSDRCMPPLLQKVLRPEILYNLEPTLVRERQAVQTWNTMYSLARWSWQGLSRIWAQPLHRGLGSAICPRSSANRVRGICGGREFDLAVRSRFVSACCIYPL